MTKYTQDQLLAMTNEQRDEIVALAQGFKIHRVNPVWLMNAIGKPTTKYHPSTNKEQAWDLLGMLSNSHNISLGDTWSIAKKGYIGEVEHKDPLTTVVIASILHLQEGSIHE